jgi:hypothetical protein
LNVFGSLFEWPTNLPEFSVANMINARQAISPGTVANGGLAPVFFPRDGTFSPSF